MAGRGQPIRVLNVAEKPSVVKAVSTILSGSPNTRFREGRSRFNKIYEFNYTIQGQQCHMLFTSVTGHLMELEFEERYRKWLSCDPVELYQVPVRKHVPEDKLDIKKTLEEEARKCEWLVLWPDCDREGENISFEVVDVCSVANRNLNIWRARFSSLIEREIHESVQHLIRPNKLFADAVDARQEIDLHIGASFTRFQTMLLKDAFVFDFATDDRNLVLSYGPCQFPTLGFVVERFWEIQAHEPEEFWTINCAHSSDDGTATFNWMRGHLFDYTCAVLIYEMCVQEPTATVSKVRQQERRKFPPHPLNTIELEKRASRYFRLSPERTMKVAEDLYQAGFISYPRTETDSFSARTDLHTIVQEQQGHPVWGSYAQRLLDPASGLWRNPSGGEHDDKAHPPIHPTKFSAGEPGWSQEQKNVYELVVRHYLACVSQPAIGAETTVEIDIAGEQFSTLGRVIIAKNYLDVYRFESWGGSVIPNYTFGQQFIPTTLTLDSGVTRPPHLLTEAELLDCMDKAGIGTDATMHDHIKKLTDRKYATKDSNCFTPTNLGQALVMGYDDMGYELWKPYLRAMMECDMKAVSFGTKSKAEVLETCLQQMKACFLDARSNKVKLFEAMEVFFERSNRFGVDEQHVVGEVVRRCDLCHNSDMDGKFMVGCLAFPQCRNVVWLPAPILEAAVTTSICNTCTPGPVFKIQFKFRRLEIPPSYDDNYLGCVGGCDDILKELVEFCGSGPRNLSSISGRGRGSTTSSSSTQRSAPRGSTTSFSSAQRSAPRQSSCIHCQQMGHSLDNCHLQTSHSSGARSQRTNPQSGESSICCNTCGMPCLLRTANTENNRGRKFNSCQAQGCNFFVGRAMWMENERSDSLSVLYSLPQDYQSIYACVSMLLDDGRNARSGGVRPNSSSSRTSSNPGRRGGRGGGRGGGAHQNKGTFVSATGEPVSGTRSCFVCGDPSHFANVSPSRGMRN